MKNLFRFRHTNFWLLFVFINCSPGKNVHFKGSFSEFALHNGYYAGMLEDFAKTKNPQLQGATDSLLFEIHVAFSQDKPFYTGHHRDVHLLDNLEILSDCHLAASPEFEAIMARAEEMDDEGYRFWFLLAALKFCMDRDDFEAKDALIRLIDQSPLKKSMAYQMLISEHERWLGNANSYIDLPTLSSCHTLTCSLRVLTVIGNGGLSDFSKKLIDKTLRRRNELSPEEEESLANLMISGAAYYESGCQMLYEIAIKNPQNFNAAVGAGWCDLNFGSMEEQEKFWIGIFETVRKEDFHPSSCWVLESCLEWSISNTLFSSGRLRREIKKFVESNDWVCCEGLRMLFALYDVSFEHPGTSAEFRQNQVRESMGIVHHDSERLLKVLSMRLEEGINW